MPILKEWKCKECEHEFERIRPECPQCNSENVGRAFRTPPGINGGRNTPHSAKRTDEILAHQFAKRGIDNFRTESFGRPHKVTWSPKSFGPPPNQAAHNVAQERIVPGFGLNTLIQSGLNPAGLKVNNQDYSVPTDEHGAYIPVGTPIGGRPTELLRQTNVIGGIDVRGKEVVRVK